MFTMDNTEGFTAEELTTMNREVTHMLLQCDEIDSQAIETIEQLVFSHHC